MKVGRLYMSFSLYFSTHARNTIARSRVRDCDDTANECSARHIHTHTHQTVSVHFVFIVGLAHTHTHNLHVGKSARFINRRFVSLRARVCMCASCYVIMMMDIACRCCYSSYSSSNSGEANERNRCDSPNRCASNEATLQ